MILLRGLYPVCRTFLILKTSSFLVLIFSCLLLLSCKKAHESNLSTEHLDYSGIDWKKDGVQDLNGLWYLSWLKTKNEISGDTEIQTPVPGYWNNITLNDESLPSFGYATYRKKILLNPDFNGSLSLSVRDFSTAYNLYWNGKLIASGGKFGKNSSVHKPETRNHILELTNIENENELLIEISNFSFFRGGLTSEIMIGNTSELQSRYELNKLVESFSVGALFIMALYHLGLFKNRRKDIYPLMFALFCLSSTLRILTTGEKLIFKLFPLIQWELSIKLEYLSGMIVSFTFCFYFTTLYYRKVAFPLLMLPAYLLLFLGVGIIFLPPYYFSNFFYIHQATFIWISLYTMFLLLYNFRNHKDITLLTLLGFFSLLLSTINDILYLNFYINSQLLLPYGFLSFVFIQAYSLSIKYSKAFSSVEKLSRQLKLSNKNLFSFQKNLEEKVKERTSELLRERTRLEDIGRVASEIVHDLKNPISSIIGFAELAEDEDLNQKERVEYLKSIEVEALRLSDMSHDILDFVKGKFEIKKKKIDLQTFFNEIIYFLSPETNLHNISIQLNINCSREFLLDAERFRRAILNIFLNSVEAFIEAEIQNPAFIIDVNTSEYDLIMRFQDNGPGIPPEFLDKILSPFFSHGKSNGTGLGLAQVRGVVEAHKGKIEINSQLEKGTVIQILIPLSESLSDNESSGNKIG
ncbi:MAG: sensor histidine kinase [Leptospiraceae bacterium]|nr:sensor histidine kinase [Leptospiraceae bacterium]MCP5512855.1 sensor histidine kinase [Leptospiraceae bacterium]